MNGLANGIIPFKDDSIHWIKFIVKDFFANTSEIMLKVKSTSQNKITTSSPAPTNLMDCLKENKFITDDISITLPPFALYDDLQFTCSKTSSPKAPYAPMHHIQNENTALQKAYTLSIKAINLPDTMKSKACIISISSKGKTTYEGGTYKDGWVTTETKSFGNLTIGIDNIPPLVKPLFILKNNVVADLTSATTIRFRAMDNLSGIKKYKLLIDAKWALCEFDPKSNTLFHTFENYFSKGNHTFALMVTDDKNNSTSVTFSFLR